MHWEDISLDALMSRSIVDASPAQVAKALRANLSDFPTKDKYAVDEEEFIDTYELLLSDLIYLTKRITPGLVQQACMATGWEVDASSALFFSQRLFAAWQFFQLKKKQSTSGAKLKPAVARLVQQVKAIDSTLGEKLLKRAKVLQRIASSPKKPENAASEKPKAQSSKAAKASKTAQAAEGPAPLAANPLPVDSQTSDVYWEDVNKAACERVVAKLKASGAPRTTASLVADTYKLYGLVAPLSTQCQESHSSSEKDAVSIASSSELEEERKLKKQPYKAQAGSPAYWDPTLGNVLMVDVSTGNILKAEKLEPGDYGFLRAYFGSRVLLTEVPNLMLETKQPKVMKRPAMCRQEKKKRKLEAEVEAEVVFEDEEAEEEQAEGEGEEEEIQEEDQEAEAEAPIQTSAKKGKTSASKATPPSSSSSQAAPVPIPQHAQDQSYTIMYYKHGPSYGFREKFYSKRQVFQLQSKTMKPEALKMLAESTLVKLNAGEQVEDVRLWAKLQLK